MSDDIPPLPDGAKSWRDRFNFDAAKLSGRKPDPQPEPEQGDGMSAEEMARYIAHLEQELIERDRPTEQPAPEPEPEPVQEAKPFPWQKAFNTAAAISILGLGGVHVVGEKPLKQEGNPQQEFLIKKDMAPLLRRVENIETQIPGIHSIATHAQSKADRANREAKQAQEAARLAKIRAERVAKQVGKVEGHVATIREVERKLALLSARVANINDGQVTQAEHDAALAKIDRLEENVRGYKLVVRNGLAGVREKWDELKHTLRRQRQQYRLRRLREGEPVPDRSVEVYLARGNK